MFLALLLLAVALGGAVVARVLRAFGSACALTSPPELHRVIAGQLLGERLEQALRADLQAQVISGAEYRSALAALSAALPTNPGIARPARG